jgi:polyribonucleotide nucleotidyltransferase
MNKYVKKETEIAGKKLVLETGELAIQANMAVKASYGDTVVLVTVVSGEANPDTDFFPLTVNYEEKLYASGLIKTSRFVKRDGRATDEAIISKRLIDHAIRPLFPKDYMDEVQVIATVLSLDDTSDPMFTAMTAVSAALHASDIPWQGPMVSARLGMRDGNFILNPSAEELEKGELDMTVSFVGAEKKFLAVEAEANVITEDKVLESLNFARDNLDSVYKLIEDFAHEVNPENHKYVYLSKAVSADLLKAISDFAHGQFIDLLKQDLDKTELKSKEAELLDSILANFEGKYKKVDMVAAFSELEKKAIQHMILDEGRRPDGRGITEIRPLSMRVGVLPRTHGSGLFTRGVTQVLTVATLGSPALELTIQNMYGEKTKRYIHYYNYPPFASGETGKMGSPGGREIGHGMLAEKALRPVIPDQKSFPYMIILVSETLSSSGSSSMAATCGSTLALMDAGVPIKDMVAGIGVGLIINDDFTKYKIMTDLAYKEDAYGFLDFKMNGTRNGVTAIQADMKVEGIPMELMPAIIAQSHEGRMFVLDQMAKVIDKPREKVSEYAPKMVSTQIPVDKIGVLIGSGGKTIKELQERTKTEIFIDDDGSVVITGSTEEGTKKAFELVTGITKDVQIGEIYDGVVKEILDFGALVEILPGKVGLMHVSEIAYTYVEDVKTWFKPGDAVRVKVIDLGENGKISLSRKALEPRPDNMPEPPARSGGYRQGNGGNGRDGDFHGHRDHGDRNDHRRG